MPGSSRRREALRDRFDPTLTAFSAIGYREAWAVLDGQLTREAAIEADATRQRRLRKAPTDVVPRRTRHRVG